MTATLLPTPDGRDTAVGSRRRLHAPIWGAVRDSCPAMVGTLVCLLILEGWSRSGVLDGRYVPAPVAIVREAVHLLGQPGFRLQVLQTTEVWIEGTLLVTLIGILGGTLIGVSDLTADVFTTPLDMLRQVPTIAVIPLMLLLFGQGQSMVLILIILGSVWPILLNVAQAVRHADRLAVETAKIFGCRGLWVLWRVRIPPTIPTALAGLRTTSALALNLAIGGEYFGAGMGGGLGQFLLNATGTTSLTPLYAGAVVAAALGLFANSGIEALERRLGRRFGGLA